MIIKLPNCCRILLPYNRPRRGRFAIEEMGMGMAVDSLQKQPARVRRQPPQEGPVGQSGGAAPPGVRNKAMLAAAALFDSEAFGGTKPDLALIKQMEQAPTSVLEGPVRLCRNSGLTGAVEVLVFPIQQS
jgi:hypothetical protein